MSATMDASASKWSTARPLYLALPVFGRYDSSIWHATVSCTATTIEYLVDAYAEVDDE